MDLQATEKQISFAKTLGISSPEKYSKQDLRLKIDRQISGKKQFEDNLKNPGNEMEEPETYRPGEPEKTPQEAYIKEFHLSPEQVNTNALMAAIEVWKIEKTVNPLKQAQIFKKFIENGD